ncbi:hypothetical protein [Aerococcus vaginalis]
MSRHYSLLASLSIGMLLVSGCASSQSNDEPMYASKPETTIQSEDKQSADDKDKTSAANDEATVDNDDSQIENETPQVETVDTLIEDVTVEGATWAEQTETVNSQLNTNDLATIRSEIETTKATPDLNAERTVETTASSEDDDSETTNQPQDSAESTVNEQETVPEQTANRLIIAKVNGLDIHALDQYSDAEILAARQAAEAIGSDAGYSYQYLQNNH